MRVYYETLFRFIPTRMSLWSFPRSINNNEQPPTKHPPMIRTLSCSCLCNDKCDTIRGEQAAGGRCCVTITRNNWGAKSVSFSPDKLPSSWIVYLQLHWVVRLLISTPGRSAWWRWIPIKTNHMSLVISSLHLSQCLDTALACYLSVNLPAQVSSLKISVMKRKIWLDNQKVWFLHINIVQLGVSRDER